MTSFDARLPRGYTGNQGDVKSAIAAKADFENIYDRPFKTIVVLHRAVRLARTSPEARVLLTTFPDALANALRIKLRRLIGNGICCASPARVPAIVCACPVSSPYRSF